MKRRRIPMSPFWGLVSLLGAEPLKTVFEYDDDLRLKTASEEDFFGAVVSSLVFEADSRTNLTGVTHTIFPQPKDRDEDQVDDDWELANGLDPTDPSDALLDIDSDGLHNLREFWAGTDPRVGNTDGDAFSDHEEIRFGSDPTSSESTPLGQVITWGSSSWGGDSGQVGGELSSGIQSFFGGGPGFVALKPDGRPIVWRKPDDLYNPFVPVPEIDGVERVFFSGWSTAVISDDGVLSTWGFPDRGGSSPQIPEGRKVVNVVPGVRVFAALLDNGSVISWGQADHGGDSSSVSTALQSGVLSVMSTGYAFAALKSNGSVVTWGHSSYGGNSSSVAGDLASGVVEVVPTTGGFGALKSDGSVIPWGRNISLSASSPIRAQLSSGVSKLFATYNALAALKDDGTVVSWGLYLDGSHVVPTLTNVSTIASNQFAFAALRQVAQGVLCDRVCNP